MNYSAPNPLPEAPVTRLLPAARVTAAALALLCSCPPSALAQEAPTALQETVAARERAFARSMADRDHAAFVTFLSAEAVFYGQRTLRGRDEVAEGWRPFFDGAQAPFSWEPEQVEVLPSGTLAHSSGPVLDADGNRVATFNSVWRLEADSVWRVVFDKGCSCADGGPPEP